MANDLNTIGLVCRLTKDPELRALPGGSTVCECRVAFNTSRKNNATGEWDDVGNFIDVTVWGAQGEALARNLTKGQRIGVHGRLEHRTWQAQDGTNRERHSIVATSVQYLDPKPDCQRAAPAQTSAPATPAATPPAQAVTPAPADDDIPF